MPSSARHDRLEKELLLLEADYLRVLLLALQECANGKWGLFEQNSGLLPPRLDERYLTETLRDLDSIGQELSALRTRLGYLDDFWPMGRLKELRAQRNSNTLGEPKLAAAFITELNSSRQ